MAESYYRLLVCAETSARGGELREVVVTVQPSARVTILDAAALAEHTVPDADVALVDAGPVVRGGIDRLRTLRARGFAGPIVIVADGPDDLLARAAAALGATTLRRNAVAADPLTLGHELAGAAGSSPDSAIMRELARTRRVLAAGEQTLRLQHDINNPLAGLLAEVQLLQLEELTPEQRASTDRILNLCRRIVGLVRRLDALEEAPSSKQVKV
jgi:signal transduction histidine kinase